MRILTALLLLVCTSCSHKYMLYEYDVPVLEGNVEAFQGEPANPVPVAVFARPDSDQGSYFVLGARSWLNQSPAWEVVNGLNWPHVAMESDEAPPQEEAEYLAVAKERGADYVLFVDCTRTEGEELIHSDLTVDLLTTGGDVVATIDLQGRSSPDAGSPAPYPMAQRALSMLGPEPVTEPHRHEYEITRTDQMKGLMVGVIWLGFYGVVFFA